jgi:hypothetical protein
VRSHLFDKEIRVFGMKRSGNSAVLSFLWNHFKKVVHIDNTNLTLYPYHAINRKIIRGDFWRKVRDIGDSGECLINIIEHMPVTDMKVCLHPHYFYNKQRDVAAFEFDKDCFAKEVFNILIVRSFHNHLASMVRLGQRSNWMRKEASELFYGTDVFMEFADLWLQYAREALGVTEFLPDKIVVLYDSLVSSKEYREDISRSLGLVHDDSGMDFVSRAKSSFDGFKYRYAAREMKVLDRWRYFLEADYSEVWWSLEECMDKLLNHEIVVYNRCLFDIDLEELFNVLVG